uniref:KdsC family phosphatase n=1 Tax=uncultured Bacteroides sp. TaxID=162156 RepID=UPI00280A8369|nr:HAD family hydrolase [uncultured Bacteroides sp.]
MLPKLVITDIDGVWTDGGMYYTAEGDVMKRFSVKDGWGVIFLRELGIPVAIMTGENSPLVQKRADKLKIARCYLHVGDKLAKAKEVCVEMGITLADVAFIGDDLNDIRLLRAVGFSASPCNTPDYVKHEVDYVTEAHGGFGAFREFVEKILADNGMLDELVKRFS